MFFHVAAKTEGQAHRLETEPLSQSLFSLGFLKKYCEIMRS